MTEDQIITLKNAISELIYIYKSKAVDFDSVKHTLMELELDFPEECNSFIEDLIEIHS